MSSSLARTALALALTVGCSIEQSGLQAIDGARLDAGDRRDAERASDTGGLPRDAGPPDRDGDGVFASSDCDDADPSVGNVAERACAGECGPGVERCVDGLWLSCDAPDDCSCSEGTTRTLSCVMCGTQAQRCVGGTWQDEGVCTGAGICSPGEIVSEEQSCGRCGTQRRARTCSASCTWGDFGPFSSCEDERGCLPGETQMRDVACGVCGNGTLTETRTCNGSCGWGAWTRASGCEDEAYCTDLFGDVVCPGSTGGNPSDCPHSHRARVCTCGSGGDWVACGACRGGW